MTDKEINLLVKKDDQPLDVDDLPEDLSALNLVGADITLNGHPVRVWNDFGVVAYEWQGARSHEEWGVSAALLLHNLSLMAECFG